MSLSERAETITLEDEMLIEPNFGAHGISIKWTTLFGSCEHLITRDKVR